jgi:hypothetical protein
MVEKLIHLKKVLFTVLKVKGKFATMCAAPLSWGPAYAAHSQLVEPSDQCCP